ncbi:MAG: hypothetical protein KAG53_11000 [Endozoicomonadaceae bacterium]|nr:hypothetical protein [Endozoicomonadaceae bacterium]
MNKKCREAICGSTSEMLLFIKANKIDIDVNRLEELDEKVKSTRHSKHSEFLKESKKIRNYLKLWFSSKDEPGNMEFTQQN